MTNELFNSVLKALTLIISLDQEVLHITLLSLRVSLTAVFLAGIIGIPLGIILGSRTFYAKNFLMVIINTGMSFPPVVMGLFIFILFSRDGYLGFLTILLTESVMMLAQFLLALPILIGLTASAVSNLDEDLKETAITLGASPSQIIWMQTREIKTNIFASVIAAFGGAISEIGAVQIVGGNIRWETRTLTTAISLKIQEGEWAFALALGIILLMIAFAINIFFTYFQYTNRSFIKAD